MTLPDGISIERVLQDGVGHHRAGRLREAEDCYKRVMAYMPNHPEALHLLGVVRHQMGDGPFAIKLILRAIEIRPGWAPYFLNLGVAYAGMGMMDDSIAALEKAIVLKPDFAEAMGNLSDAYLKRDWPDKAIAIAEKALSIRADHIDSAINLGVALQAVGRLDEAGRIFRQIIARHPDFAAGHFNLGNVLRNQGNPAGAIDVYRRAIAINPNFAEAHNNLGQAMFDLHRLDEAAESFRQATTLRPDYAAAMNNYANAMKLNGFVESSIAAYRRAMELAPREPVIRSSFIYTIFCSPKFNEQDQFIEQRKFNELFGKPMAGLIESHRNDRSPDRKLRIGYVSSDFRNQISGLHALPLLKLHNQDQFEVFGYSSTLVTDARSAEFQAACDHWRAIERTSDEKVAALIREDHIDILMDLNVHSAGNRLPLFARKPAPVQATFIGYPGSTGLDAMDYRITDPYLDPVGKSEKFYSEKCERLPDCFWSYDPATMRSPTNSVAPPPMRANGFFTFGCLNNICKIHDGVLKLWARVLRATPKSRLLLLVPGEVSRKWIPEKFAKEGIGADRIIFVGRQSHVDYMKTYDRIDLCLDTFPCSGHSTSLDSLWMGVPMVTLVGDTVVCRASWSQLCNLDLKQFAAFSEDEFVKIATTMAGDADELVAVRASLRQKMLDSPLCDIARFKRNVEAIYRKIWRNWCEKGN